MTPRQSILDHLRRIKEEALRNTGLLIHPQPLYFTARQAILAAKLGYWNPSDTSVHVWITDGKIEMVQEFLETFKGPEA